MKQILKFSAGLLGLSCLVITAACGQIAPRIQAPKAPAYTPLTKTEKAKLESFGDKKVNELSPDEKKDYEKIMRDRVASIDEDVVMDRSAHLIAIMKIAALEKNGEKMPSEAEAQEMPKKFKQEMGAKFSDAIKQMKGLLQDLTKLALDPKMSISLPSEMRDTPFASIIKSIQAGTVGARDAAELVEFAIGIMTMDFITDIEGSSIEAINQGMAKYLKNAADRFKNPELKAELEEAAKAIASNQQAGGAGKKKS